MTSAPQILGPAIASSGLDPRLPVGGGISARPHPFGTDKAVQSNSATSAQSASGRDPVRLPGQEGLERGGLRRPLISGGAFTLAVALALAQDPLGRAESAASDSSSSDGAEGEGDNTDYSGLTEGEQETVRELKQRDAEVRRHEAAHAAAGGQYAGPPTFTYQRGPDGRQYAVGGSVSIDTSPVQGDPEATIQKARQIKAAANAPADPSSQDRRIAGQADAMLQQAQAEVRSERQQERQQDEAEAEAGETQQGVLPGDPFATDAATFSPAAFGSAAALYRGFSPTPNLFSIAV